MRKCKCKSLKLGRKKLNGFLFFIFIFGWKENERKKIEEKLFFLIYLSKKWKERKKLILSNDNFILILLLIVIPIINIELCKKLVKIN